MQGEWHLAGSGQDDGGVANADDENDDDCDSGGIVIIGIGVVGDTGGRAVNEDEDDRISDLESAGWLSLVRYPSARLVRASGWSDPSFAFAAFIGGGGERVPLEFRWLLWYIPISLVLLPGGVIKVDSRLVSCAGVDMVCGTNEDEEGEGKGEAVSYRQPTSAHDREKMINSGAQCTANGVDAPPP